MRADDELCRTKVIEVAAQMLNSLDEIEKAPDIGQEAKSRCGRAREILWQFIGETAWNEALQKAEAFKKGASPESPPWV